MSETSSRRVIKQDGEPESSLTPKDSRIDLRVTKEQKALLEEAASIKGVSLSAYTLLNLLPLAQQDIENRERLRLSNRDRDLFVSAYTNGLGDGNPNGSGNQRKSMVQSVEASLKRLNTDYMDVLWLHAWDFMTPAEEVMRAFDDLVRAGKVLYIGISDAPAWVVSQCNTLAELR